MVHNTLELNDEKKSSKSASLSDPRIGQKLHQYRILAEIGQGGMSVVYKGQDERLGRLVAIKILHSFLAKKADCRARLAREARTVAGLQHPNIVQVFDYSGEDENLEDPNAKDLFIVTELVSGLTLNEFAEAHAIHDVPELGAWVVLEIARALAYAHSKGVIHRDIKPENIMVRDDGTLKLMDFGIAQVGNQESLTLTGTLLGSPAHMAPESIEGKPSDQRADVFSLSTVFYWLATGALPYTGSSPHALLKAIVDGRFAPPQQSSNKIWDGLSDVILRGMATNPDERYQSIDELAMAIADALEAMGLSYDSSELKTILAKGNSEIGRFKTRVLRSCLAQAGHDKAQGEVAKAMSLIGRVLADEPENVDALRLLDGYEPKTAPTRFAGWIALAVVAGILALTVLTSGLFETLRSDSKQQMPQKPVGVAKQQEAENPPREPEAPAKPIPLAEPVPTKEAKKKITTMETHRPVLVTITPFADVYLDGKKVAENKSNLTLHVPFGEHTLLFKHQYAANEEQNIVVREKDEVVKVDVSLERSKPAALVVASNVEADISVGGIYKGTTLATQNRPILIPLPKKTHSLNLEVVISKTGFEPSVATVRFVAGQTKLLNLNLQPSKTNS